MLKTRFRVVLTTLAVACGCANAQSAAEAFQKAPAGVEDALRERVTAFYSLHKEGKFRQAEAMVCEESRDTYYDSDKRRWTSVEIIRVTFEKDFQAAKVLVALGTEMSQRGTRVPAIFPFNGTWRLEGGKWCHYLPPPSKGETVTPFGIMKQTEGGKGQAAIPAMPPSPQAAAAQILSSIRFSKRQLKVKGYEPSSDELEIFNGLPGALQLGVYGAGRPGLNWQLTAGTLKSGERAQLKLTYNPPDKSPKAGMEIKVVLEPLGVEVPIEILFDIPESVKQQLPPAVRQ
jgi:hypothetical protein